MALGNATFIELPHNPRPPRGHYDAIRPGRYLVTALLVAVFVAV